MVLLTIFPYSRPLWSRRVVFGAPELGLKAQSAAICWTLLVPAANVLNNATQTMNFMPWLRVSAPATCRSKCLVNKTQPSVSTKNFKIESFLFLTTCLSVRRQIGSIFHFSVSARHAHRCMLLLFWASMENIPDCNGSHLVMLTPCLAPLPLYSLVPTPAASGTYWRQSHTEP